MVRVAVVAKEQQPLAEFAAALESNRQIELILVDSAAAVLEVEKSEHIDLAVVGEELADTDAVDCVNQLIRFNPMITCAMVSAMPPEDFHEATEGLGILMQLPPIPSAQNAAALMARYESLVSMFAGSTGKGVRR